MSESHSPPDGARGLLELRTRRTFLGRGMAGLGALWLSDQLAGAPHAAPAAREPGGASPPASANPPDAAGPVDPARPLAPRGPHHAPRARSVIYLHMAGAPSQLELFDYKPELAKRHGQDCPQELMAGRRFAFLQGTPRLQGPVYPFHRAGQSGQWVSDRLPHFERVIDRVCFIRTMRTDQFNHSPAQLLVQTGQPRPGYASAGSWVTYGLGSENQNLPGYVVLLSGGRAPSAGKGAWGAGFLPGAYQGVSCRATGDPLPFLSNPAGVDGRLRGRMVDAIAAINRHTHAGQGDPATLARTTQYELAYRMQMAGSDAMRLDDETATTRRHYGAQPGRESFANNCLLARRLVERGVRYVQLFDWGWDSHGDAPGEALNAGFKKKCRDIDRPIAALLTDLQQRGLLEETLVVWSGEFGRTPMRENRGGREMRLVGRDHHGVAFTLWMAGGGVKGGVSIGETDPIGFGPVTRPVEVRDLHATMLHLLGLDPTRLSYPFQGLDQKLTGVHPARVVEEALA